jgi:hypothetical protein
MLLELCKFAMAVLSLNLMNDSSLLWSSREEWNKSFFFELVCTALLFEEGSELIRKRRGKSE